MIGLNEQWLISFFVARLHDQLKCELLLAQPSTFYHILAKLHEQKMITLQNSLEGGITKLNAFSVTPKASNNRATYYLSNNNNNYQPNNGSGSANPSNPVTAKSSNTLVGSTSNISTGNC